MLERDRAIALRNSRPSRKTLSHRALGSMLALLHNNVNSHRCLNAVYGLTHIAKVENCLERAARNEINITRRCHGLGIGYVFGWRKDYRIWKTSGCREIF